MVMAGYAFTKNSLREICRTLGRYLAILTIIALGVGFFAGLRVTRTAMVKTGDTYLSGADMFDFRLISTLGITDGDVEYFDGIDGVKAAEGAITEDFLTTDSTGTECVLKALSIGEINAPVLTAGRMPEKGDECLADAQKYGTEDIGKVITVTDGGETADNLKYSEYTIVGLCQSPLYLSHERGTTTLRGGSVAAFVYIPEDGFDFQAYTDLYIVIDKQGEIFSDQYSTEIDAMRDDMEARLEQRAELRYEEIAGDAQSAVDDAQKEYDDGYSKYLAEKADAERKLAEARDELDSARKTLDSSKEKLTSGEAELESGERQYAAGKAEYDANMASFQQKKEETLVQLDESQRQIDEGRKMALDGIEQITATGVIDNYEQLCTAEAELQAQLAALPEESEEYAQLSAQLAQVQAQKKAIEDTGVIDKFNGLTKTVENLDNAQLELDDAKEAANEQLAAAERELDRAENELKNVREQLDSSKRTLSAGWIEYENGEEQYSQGLTEYEASKNEAEKSFAEAEKKLEDAKAEIENARREIEDIPHADTYVLDRETNTGYVCYNNDSLIVQGVAKVFPVFFFLVAALVCVTTMTRMVDDQRTQIGTLKALGYSNARIIWKYVCYSGSAAVIGCVSGFLLGSWLFPKAIWRAYSILYGFCDIILVFDWKLGIISLAVSIICSSGATFAACRRDLGEVPAELMRPKAPAIGKRILLEKISVIWRKMPFLHKVTARNIFRYKKRMLMMVMGISGCTALVITGLGVRDSVCNIVNDQFDNIMKYDYTISFADGQSEAERAEFEESTKDILSKCVFVCGDTVDVECGSTLKTANIIATSDSAITDIIDLHLNGNKVEFPKDGCAALSRKLADMAGVETGDKVTLRLGDTDTVELTVSGVFENYVYSYVLMTESTYTGAMQRTARYDTAYAVYSGDDLHGDAAVLVNDYGASAVTVTQDARNMIDNMLSSMNYIVMLVIACAGALAFIVLFNLSNINITERQREIATIEVLGFYPNETRSYVFRENMVLSAIGAAVGIILGTALHRYVMSQIKVDMVAFQSRITLLSYVIGVAATFLFTFIVDIIMRKKLKRINMAEALKSIE